MLLHVGCEFQLTAAVPVASVWQVKPMLAASNTVVAETWTTVPAISSRAYVDTFGNRCERLVLPHGPTTVTYRARVEVSGEQDAELGDAAERDVDELPDRALRYLLPSRLCPSDILAVDSLRLFGARPSSGNRVQRVCDWVHEHVSFQYGGSTAMTSAADVYRDRVGVCRDFAHLAVTMVRALNIPARYTYGYIPDIGVIDPTSPMDFCAWLEVWLDDRWHTVDPRNNTPRIGRVVIGYGCDAIDVAMLTTFGAVTLELMTVWADLPGGADTWSDPIS